MSLTTDLFRSRLVSSRMGDSTVTGQYVDQDWEVDDVRSDGIITDPWGLISSIKCIGDLWGDDACNTKDYPYCSGCEIRFNPIELLKPFQ